MQNKKTLLQQIVEEMGGGGGLAPPPPPPPPPPLSTGLQLYKKRLKEMTIYLCGFSYIVTSERPFSKFELLKENMSPNTSKISKDIR